MANMELSKYIKSESVELNRSAIHFADYNPRKLSDESRKTLKRGIKKFGLVGGIVVNKRTGLTVVSGHQRLSVMDELQKFPDNELPHSCRCHRRGRAAGKGVKHSNEQP